MQRNWKFWAGACGGLALGVCGMALGQEGPRRVIVIDAGEAAPRIIKLAEQHGDQPQDGKQAQPQAVQAKPAAFWIGVALDPEGLPELLQKHLRLKAGVLVSEVYDDSPAAQAGLKAGDILLRAGDQELAGAADLIAAVSLAGEKPLAIKYLREGREGELKVTPAKRNAAEVEVELAGPGGTPPEVEAWLRKLPHMGQLFRNPGAPGADLLIPRPEAIWLQSGGKLPAGVKVQVTKEGDKPAQIHVERDGKTWDVDEQTLDKLPVELRGPVQSMLGGGMAFAPGNWLEFGALAAPADKDRPQLRGPRFTPGQPLVAPRMVAPNVEAKLDAILKKLDASSAESHQKLERELQQLRSKLEALQQKVDGKE